VLLVSLSLFIVATASCITAPDATWLIVSRIGVGCAAGLISPQIVGLIQQSFDGHRRGRAYGFYSASISLSAVIGPLLGGTLISAMGPVDGWRFAFLLSPCIGIATLVVAYRALPRDSGGSKHGSFDLLGIVLLGLTTVAVMLPVTEASGSGARSAWWLLGVGLVALALFCWWESRQRRPLVDLTLLGRRSYTVGALTVLFFYAGYPGVLLMVQFYLQRGLHYSALAAAASTMVFGIGSSVAAIVGGRVVARLGRRIVVVGCVAVAVGVGVTALLVDTGAHGNAVLMLSGPFLLAGLGSGFIVAPNQTLAMADIPRSEASTAGGVYQTGMRLGSSVGVPLAIALYSSGLHTTHGNVFTASALGLVGSAALTGLALVVRLVDMARKPALVPLPDRPQRQPS
jgi:MFS family permease